MKIGKISKTIMICVSLLALSIPCLAKEGTVPGQYEQKNVPADAANHQPDAANHQPDATIVSIDNNNVTLQGIEDKDKKITAPFINASEFKVGDRVIVSGNTLIKI